MKTFICIAALFVVGAFAERCFKSDAAVGTQTFDVALKECMGDQKEADKKTYKCMIGKLGFNKDSPIADVQTALEQLAIDAAALKTLTANCLQKRAVPAYLECMDKVLSEKCSDDNDLSGGTA